MREFYKWRDDVVEQIRFRPDRAAVAEELTAHYEDHVKDLERLGYEHELADQRALGAMGDPVEIGKAMDRVHQPWLGWLWLVSKALAVLSLIVVLLYGGPTTSPSSRIWNGQRRRQIMKRTGICRTRTTRISPE